MNESFFEYITDERKKNILLLNSTDSTNNEIKRTYQGKEHGYIVVSEMQTNGRGRRGRSFFSENSNGLYFSYYFKTEEMGLDLASVTARSAVAVREAIFSSTGIKTWIKWVNDLFVCGKKVCGILCEQVNGGVIIGIGININEEKFPCELKNIATSLMLVMGKKYKKSKIFSAIVYELDKMTEGFSFNKQEYLNKYREFCFVTGKEILVIKQEEAKIARCVSVNDDFTLKVIYENGKEEDLLSGEISIKQI